MARVCEIESFRYTATPQPEAEEGASGTQINEQSLEDYLNRLREAMCADIQDLQDQIDSLESRVTNLESVSP